MSENEKELPLNPEQIQEAREWLSECTFREIEDPSEFDEMSDERICKGIKRHFCGGIQGFIDTLS